MSYEETLVQLKDIYKDSEKQFLEFSEIIPFIDNPWYVHSPRLYGLLHLICSQVESLFSLIVNQLQIQPQNDDLNARYDIINNGGVLEEYKLVLVKGKKIIQPFRKITQPLRGENLTFGWWTAYNGSKHGFPEGIKFATIGNVLHSLASAYILHEIAYVAKFNVSVKVLNTSNWHDENIDWIKNPEFLRSMHYAQEKIDSEFFVNFRRFWIPEHGAG